MPFVLLRASIPMGQKPSCRMPNMKKPRDLSAKRPLTIQGPVDDPLGYETTDFLQCAREMSRAALAGRNSVAVKAELEAVRKRLGRGRGR